MERTQEFGRMLRTLREQRNLTQEDLAELIDRSVQAVSKMERGLTFPKLETLIRISKKFQIPLSEIVSVFDPNEKPDSDRLEIELSIIESAKCMSFNDLVTLSKITKALTQKTDKNTR